MFRTLLASGIDGLLISFFLIYIKKDNIDIVSLEMGIYISIIFLGLMTIYKIVFLKYLFSFKMNLLIPNLIIAIWSTIFEFDDKIYLLVLFYVTYICYVFFNPKELKTEE